ncbi:nudix hydrolase 15, mitochondrial-like [Diospyros lotus]|uniref:nudix hydrolase 15, mitochondrial-like n=1 Tax=Diospyros lotus TaxID=55363 RepID=UPI0022547839|nr:nudix hydrolase 15, mitochondrial-like [Diospyros lotus]
MACTAADSSCMETEVGCRKLQSLAKRLRCYRPTTSCSFNMSRQIENHENILNTSDHSDRAVNSSSTITNKPAASIERRAAVLICLFQGTAGELRVILTKRSMNLYSHPGEVALPGGKREEGDADDAATALREAVEEIGLNPALVEVVANLEPFISQHQLVVAPVVGLLSQIEDYKPVLNADEVDAIFDAPLEMFLEEERHRWEEREWKSWKYSRHLFDYESEQGDFVIGGLTASILIRAASIIYQRSPSFTQHLPDFQELQKIVQNAVAL